MAFKLGLTLAFKKTVILFFLLFLIETASPGPRLIAVGEERSFPTPRHAKIFVKGQSKLRVRDLGTHIRVQAPVGGIHHLRIGESSVTLWALPLSSTTDAEVLEPEIATLKGLSFLYDKGGWTVTGELWRFKDWLLLQKMFSNATYSFRARAEPAIAREARNYIFAEFRRRSIPLPQGQWSPSLPLTFGALTPSQKAAVKELGLRWGIEVEVHEGAMALGPLVRLRVLIAEIHQSFLRELGLSWQNTYQAQVIPRWQDQGGFMAEIKNLESKGHGQVLAAPNLLCRSGGAAQFMAGGEFAVKLQGLRQQKVNWKRHGVLLQFRPVAGEDGRLTLAMSIEISLIDPTQTVDGIPGLKINRIESQLNFLSGKTLVLSGLLKNQLGRSTEGLALLQQIPILGSLFRSQSYLENRTELVVFVTPTVEALESPGESESLPQPWQNLEFLNDT